MSPIGRHWRAAPSRLAHGALAAPDGPPGLVIVNPPYGARIGDTKSLAPLYRALGQTLLGRFSGWRVAQM